MSLLVAKAQVYDDVQGDTGTVGSSTNLVELFQAVHMFGLCNRSEKSASRVMQQLQQLIDGQTGLTSTRHIN